MRSNVHRNPIQKGVVRIMRISLISLHFSEYAARLALALSARHTVQLHLSQINADDELSPALYNQIKCATDLHLHPQVTRKACLRRGIQIARRIQKFQPDIIHAQEAGDWAIAVTRLLCFRKPFVYTVHDPKPHSGSDQQVAERNRLPRLLLRHYADAIIVHGDSIIRDLEEVEPAAIGKIRSVFHGILGESLPPPSEPGSGIIFFGRIEAYKGLDILLDAMDLLRNRDPGLRLHIAGRGPGLIASRERIAAMPNVSLDEAFVPADAVPELLRTARALVLPYLNATQSGVVANAFGAAVPVIASRVGALIDVLDEGRNSLLVPPGDAAKLADAIERVAKDSTLAKHLAQGAARTAAGILAWSTISLETEAVYAGCRRP